MKQNAIEFIKKFEKKAIPLSKEAHNSFFEASISGKPEDYQKASDLQLKLEKIFADKNDFETIKEIMQSDNLSDELINRQIELLYNAFAEKQFDEKLLEEIVKLSTEIEQSFSTFRADINGKKLTDNEIDKILQESTDSKELQKTWEASKQVGEEVSERVIN